MTKQLKYNIIIFPTEIILELFSYLSAKDLINCRSVCSSWKLLVDELNSDDLLWRKYCAEDYEEIYKTAKSKCRPGMRWYDLYKSLSLWSKLGSAWEEQDEFAAASQPAEEIHNFILLNDGVLGVHLEDSIVYYDLESRNKTDHRPIFGRYLRFDETDDVIVLQDILSHLYVTRKLLRSPTFEIHRSFDDVRMFLLSGKDLYYITLDHNLFHCDLLEDRLFSTKLTESPEGVICMSYKGKLRVLTFDRKIFTLNNGKLDFTWEVEDRSLHTLKEMDFFENFNWRIYIQWHIGYNWMQINEQLYSITVMKVYGDVVIVGTRYGVLRFYYAPYSSGYMDLFNTKPVKQWNFMERPDCPVLSDCSIFKIDVVENYEGHSIIVAMPKKIVILSFSHGLKRSASGAMLPLENRNLKVLKIDDALPAFL